MENKFEIDVAGQLKHVQSEIAVAVRESSRMAGQVKLVAVSKTFPPEAIRLALNAGQRVFGENRVQEAAGKWSQLRTEYDNIELHLIGPLQTNKSAVAVELFDCIETLDRPKLAKVIAAELTKQQKSIELFVQVNTGAEPQKAGVLVDDLPSFLELCRGDLKLNVTGLMCIPPIGEVAQKHFSLLSDLAQQHNLSNLSMGMSADYEVAIKSGATHVRLGSAIFGRRQITPSGPD